VANEPLPEPYSTIRDLKREYVRRYRLIRGDPNLSPPEKKSGAEGFGLRSTSV
jgi:hypothetical protein